MKTLVILLMLCTLISATDAQARKTGKLRDKPVTLVVIHSTGGPTCDFRSGTPGGKPIWVAGGQMEENLRIIEAHPQLGIHYMIGKDGELRTSVPENQIAHHVLGYSEQSIAIELINDGDGKDPFPDIQINTLITLLRDIQARHKLPRKAFVRHSDLDTSRLPCDRSQRRKVDPGDAFPYEYVLSKLSAQVAGD